MKPRRLVAIAEDGFAATAVLALALLAAYAGSLAYPQAFDDVNVTGVALEAWLGQPLHPRWLSAGSFAVTNALAGPGVLAARLENLLLHAAAAAAIYLLCRSLGRRAPSAAPAALAAALVFALHPVAVYGVAYLGQRSIVMATLCSVLALHAWLCALRSGRTGWLAASVGWFALAALSKEHAVMLPGAIAALTIASRGEVRASRAALGAAFAAHAAIAVALIVHSRGLIGTVYESYLVAAVAQASAAEDQIYLNSILTQAGLFFRYLATWLVPLPELMAIDLRLELVRSPGAPAAIAGAAGFLAYGIAGMRLLGATGVASRVGFAMLVPWILYFTEFAAVRAQEPFVLYRSYLWAIGLPIGISALAQLVPWRALGALALCVALAFGTRERLATFSTPVALWDDAVRKLEHDALPFADRAIANRGVALLDAGRTAEALGDLNRAILVNPLNERALASRASLHVASGDARRAEADFAEALRVRPVFPGVYAARCGLRAAQGRTAAALEDCEEALRQAPELALARLNLGVLHAQRGELRRAILEFERVLAAEPENATAAFNLLVCRARLGST